MFLLLFHVDHCNSSMLSVSMAGMFTLFYMPTNHDWLSNFMWFPLGVPDTLALNLHTLITTYGTCTILNTLTPPSAKESG